jgi:hypothetical protein
MRLLGGTAATGLRSAVSPVQVAALLPVICASGAQLRKGQILSARDWTTLALAFESLEGKRDLIGAAEPGSGTGCARACGTAGTRQWARYDAGQAYE